MGNCCRKKELFLDEEFKLESFETLKRPSELVDNPKLFVDGPSRFDVVQGYLGKDSFKSGILNP